MNPGRLREKITVQQRSDTTPSTGRSPERSESPWTDEFTDRADPKLDNQRSDIVGGQEEPSQRATFLVRTRAEYRAADITQKRIVWEGDAYEIEAVRPVDQQRRYLEVSAVYKGDTA